MPKIIKDLRARIIKTSINIFNEKGFNAIDMRKIATDCHIAVGTLYNYFPNKKELMYEVFNELWIESIDRLDKFIEEAEPGEGLLVRYASALYKEMDKKKGIGKQIFRLELIETKEDEMDDKVFYTHSKFNEIHMGQMKKVFKKCYELEDEQIEGDNFTKLMNTSIFLMMVNKSSGEEYALFLSDLVRSYIKEYIK